MYKEILNIYNTVYCKVYGNIPKEPKLEINYFLSVYHEDSLGSNFIKDYILFQFEYYNGQDNKMSRIQPSWIFGKKAIERWRSKNDNWLYFVEQFKNRLKINFKVEKKPISIDFNKIRQENKNKPSGYLDCKLKGMFDRLNYICITCKNNNLCDG